MIDSCGTVHLQVKSDLRAQGQSTLAVRHGNVCSMIMDSFAQAYRMIMM